MRSLLLACLLLAGTLTQADAPIRVGSKNFNESYLLAEMLAQLLEDGGYRVERRFGLGGSLICYQALVKDEIDVYVEYTGTLGQAILGRSDNPAPEVLDRLVAPSGIRLLDTLGFNNTYALVLRRPLAESLGIQTIGDMAAHPGLRIAVSHELLARRDGWPGLAERYGLPGSVPGIEHGLAYQAIADGAVDVTDAYSTDGELKRYDLLVLEDDLGYFPQYLAVPLVREGLPAAARTLIGRLQGLLDDEDMQALNAQVTFEGRGYTEVAGAFLEGKGLIRAGARGDPLSRSLVRNTLQHLKLTGIAVGAAVLVGVGLSLLVFRSRLLARGITYLCGLIQTIPSIALLALMIPLLGIGVVPAILALFLYSLLPIVRNSLTALTTVDPTLVRVALSMGLSPAQRLRYLYLPLSLPSMFAGVRTAAVICIGTATLAAFIGAGAWGIRS